MSMRTWRSFSRFSRVIGPTGGTAGQVPVGAGCWPTRVRGGQAGHHLAGPDQHRSGLAPRMDHHVQTPVHAVRHSVSRYVAHWEDLNTMHTITHARHGAHVDMT